MLPWEPCSVLPCLLQQLQPTTDGILCSMMHTTHPRRSLHCVHVFAQILLNFSTKFQSYCHQTNSLGVVSTSLCHEHQCAILTSSMDKTCTLLFVHSDHVGKRIVFWLHRNSFLHKDLCHQGTNRIFASWIILHLSVYVSAPSAPSSPNPVWYINILLHFCILKIWCT